MICVFWDGRSGGERWGSIERWLVGRRGVWKTYFLTLLNVFRVNRFFFLSASFVKQRLRKECLAKRLWDDGIETIVLDERMSLMSDE